MMFRKNKKKYYAWILQKEQGLHERIGKKRVRATTKQFKYKGKPFSINIELPSYSRGLKRFYFFDFNSKAQIVLGKHTANNTDADIYDMIHLKKVVSQLTANLGDNTWKINLMTLLIGVALGGGFGFIIAGYI